MGLDFFVLIIRSSIKGATGPLQEHNMRTRVIHVRYEPGIYTAQQERKKSTTDTTPQVAFRLLDFSQMKNYDEEGRKHTIARHHSLNYGLMSIHAPLSNIKDNT